MDDKSDRKQRTVYTIIEKPGRKPFWMRIGVAHINQDQSWNVYLDALPFDRKLQIREEELRPRPNVNDAPVPPLSRFEAGGIQ